MRLISSIYSTVGDRRKRSTLTIAKQPHKYNPLMTASTERAPLAIIGGGLAVLTFSLRLTRQGIPHKFYESVKVFLEIGAGITLGPNSVTALELIDPKITDALRKCITYNQDLETEVEGEVDATNPKRSDWLEIRVGMEEG